MYTALIKVSKKMHPFFLPNYFELFKNLTSEVDCVLKNRKWFFGEKRLYKNLSALYRRLKMIFSEIVKIKISLISTK